MKKRMSTNKKIPCRKKKNTKEKPFANIGDVEGISFSFFFSSLAFFFPSYFSALSSPEEVFSTASQ